MAQAIVWRPTVDSPRLRLRTVRARSTIVATAIVGLALALMSVAAVTLQRIALIDTIDSGLITRADDVAGLVISGSVPDQIAVAGDDDALVQVVDANGTVVAASENIDGEGPIVAISGEAVGQVVTTRSLPTGDGSLRLVSRRVSTDRGDFTIYAAASLEQVTESVAVLSATLLVGVPLLAALVGVTVWVIIGRSLRPVEEIRSQVSSIGDRELDRRVPVPDTSDEIASLATTMNQMLERLQDSSNQQRRFVADASHELRSPLATIRSELEVHQAHPGSEEWPRIADAVLQEALRMQRLIDDLLLLAKSDAAIHSVPVTAVDLDDLVFDQVERLQSTTAITFDTSKVSGAQVIGDQAALERLIRNLLENACRYAVSAIDITLSEIDQRAIVIIEDDGPGIAEDDRERVFDRFTRLDEARDRDHGGTGLGLAIVSEIVRRHGGTVEVDHSSTGGALLRVDLPRNPPPTS